MAELDTLLPVWMLDIETQAVIITALCCVGAWVIFKWIIQFIFSVIWPLFAVIGVMLLLPSFRKTIAYDVLPKKISAVKFITRCLLDAFNSMRFET